MYLSRSYFILGGACSSLGHKVVQYTVFTPKGCPLGWEEDEHKYRPGCAERQLGSVWTVCSGHSGDAWMMHRLDSPSSKEPYATDYFHPDVGCGAESLFL